MGGVEFRRQRVGDIGVGDRVGDLGGALRVARAEIDFNRVGQPARLTERFCSNVPSATRVLVKSADGAGPFGASDGRSDRM